MDHRAGLAVGQLVGMVVDGFAGVHPDPHQPGFRQGVIGDDAFDGIGQEHTDPVTRFEARSQKRVAQTVGGCVEFGEAHDAVVLHEAGRGLEMTRCASDERSDLHW